MRSWTCPTLLRYTNSAFFSSLLESTARVFREWLGTFPRDAVAVGNLANNYVDMGQYEQAAELNRQALQLSPNDVISYINYAFVLIAVNQFTDARKVIQQAFEHGLDAEQLHGLLFELAFIDGDTKGMAEQTAWRESRPQAFADSLGDQSAVAAYSGLLRTSDELARRTAAAPEAEKNPENASAQLMNSALRDAAFGNVAQVQRSALTASQKPLGTQAQATAALVFAWADDAKRMESLLDGLGKQFPQGTLVQSMLIPTVRARLELSRGNPQRSIELLRTATPYELTGSMLNGCLYPAYVRGESYLAAKQGAAAQVEFQKILNHRGIVGSCETGAVARLGLARSYVLQNDDINAKNAYQDFLTLWKDADPDIPILKQAKAEYAKLQ
jgi:tetratricopeptide (TPR) repeat protein